MPTIRFAENQFPDIQADEGSTLMQSLLQAQVPVASSCKGDGICSKCRIKITEGADQLSEETDFERGLRERNHIGAEYRISCQARIVGDLTVHTNYW